MLHKADDLPVAHSYVKVNGVTLHVVTAGPADGAPLLLLHGFPEFWYGWRRQIPFLAQQGFRLIVPDQRGYHLSEKPRRAAAYDLDVLAADVVGLIDHFGYERVFLAGHDWGAVVAWWLAGKAPQRLRRLAVLNVPHPAVATAAIREGNWRQALRSWYILFFQLPWLPELGFRLSAASDGMNLMQLSGRQDTFSAADIAAYRRAWSQPGALSGMINWYRALLRRGPRPHPGPGVIETPTLILWGERDVALGKELAQASLSLCRDGRLVFFPQATHWVQHDEAEAVNRNLGKFFKEEA